MANEILQGRDVDNVQSLETGSRIRYEFGGQQVILETHREVWSPTQFTLGMCEMIAQEDFTGQTVIDLASGSGILGIVAAQRGAKVIFLDLNPTAVKMTSKNWILNGLRMEDMDVHLSDCFDALEMMETIPRVDRIITNPPTAPAHELVGAHQLPATATEWNSIENGDGRKVTDAAILQGAKYLMPGGELMFVTTSKQGPLTTMRILNNTYGQGIVLAPDSGIDPLNYQDTTSQDYNWKVQSTKDIELDSWYLPYLEIYQTLNEQRGDLPPVFENDKGKLVQRLYFIRARKSSQNPDFIES